MLTYRFGLKKTRNWDKNTNKFSLKIEDPKRQNEKKNQEKKFQDGSSWRFKMFIAKAKKKSAKKNLSRLIIEDKL